MDQIFGSPDKDPELGWTPEIQQELDRLKNKVEEIEKKRRAEFGV